MLIGSRHWLTVMACSLVLATILCPGRAQACKDRMYPVSFPIEELERYEHVYVVKIATVTFDAPLEESRYAGPFTFEGKVVRALKGPKKAGEAILGATTSHEEAHARCPILLEAGKTYLLMLNGDRSPYALPRYGSLYISSDEPEFQNYIVELTKRPR